MRLRQKRRRRSRSSSPASRPRRSWSARSPTASAASRSCPPGLALFTLCAAGSALAPSIDALLGFRLVQGAAAGAVGILPRAIIRDLFEGREARLQPRRRLARVQRRAADRALAGAGILIIGSWRSIYVVLTGVGAILLRRGASVVRRVACGRAPPQPQAFDGPRRLPSGADQPLGAGFSLLAGLVFAGLFAYATSRRSSTCKATACRRQASRDCSPSPPPGSSSARRSTPGS